MLEGDGNAALLWLLQSFCRLPGRVLCWPCATRLDEKTALLTAGGSAGIGYQTTKALVSRGGRLIHLHIPQHAVRYRAHACAQMGQLALISVIEASGGLDVVLKYLDFCFLASVWRLANDIVEKEPRLDLLVNNAGRTEPFQRTLD
ncbi:hypothetical protein HPB52_014335 [Rhipicephalus sanguineus]|uniref:Uncharacterized protein n=1 Tax=Rhipicephalus sanguineus TaxID=34632 RepID=A0A9D4SUH3_RHISA|nr:hypothetical protein HPB52_014335 [Rhipicephalus sanguineus]